MITPQRIDQFLSRVRRVRSLQVEYRRTQDARLRHQLPALELDLDNDAELLRVQLLAAAQQVEAEQAEGGVA
ncbi:hypothetical protein R5W23_000862 [Gemmata sp. JC673]|uniref:Uncharacterized protein n=1 Tax=Gemmata algarum TaxID=2975278 RepID=A0ABU5ES19_9BACT|nr:hypothetical protein [Gemmata algarum]MDY3558141.1 hypothetical protein [Gemmata algarum]